MLVNIADINPTQSQKSIPENGMPFLSHDDNGNACLVFNSNEPLHKILGDITPNQITHFYSHGTFNSVRLLFHVLKYTGPANVLMSTYSISEKSVRQLYAAKNNGAITDIRFLIDNRVRSMSPKPFQFLMGSFPNVVRTLSIHAKITLVWNEHWTVSIISSMNATDNNKIERGVIFTTPEVFEYDLKALTSEYERGNA